MPERPDSTVHSSYPQTHLALRQHQMYQDYPSQISPTQQYSAHISRGEMPNFYRVPSTTSYPSTTTSYAPNVLMPPLGSMGHVPSQHRYPELQPPYQQSYGQQQYAQIRTTQPSYSFGDENYDNRYRTDLGNVPEVHDNT